ncbi:hypothetical protein PYCCODRAFT_1475796 [Trametes coccinea BRFM310]|uniref:Uncharacterized protein n=1 Tax=Trametes coccinea (strain BRFM310) TaxID=1353009 RepID=A0A1Y2IVN3_TRAC3|nr:hypothetical protein PYCCODRAFT_1475796 [Trametes coccinea BRFM310]
MSSASSVPELSQSTVVDSSALTATLSPPFIGDSATLSNVSATAQAALEPLVNSLYDHTYWAITQSPGWVITHDFIGDYVQVVGFSIPWTDAVLPAAEYSVDGRFAKNFTAPQSASSMLNVTYYTLSSDVLTPGQHTLQINITRATQDDPWLIDYIIFGTTGVSTTIPSTPLTDSPGHGSASPTASSTTLPPSSQNSKSSASTTLSASIAPASAGHSNLTSSFPLAPVIGGVAGGIVVIAALSALLYYFWRRSRDSGAFVAEEHLDKPDAPKQPSINGQRPPRDDDHMNSLPRGKGPLRSTTTSYWTAPASQPAGLSHAYSQGPSVQQQQSDWSHLTPLPGWAQQRSTPPVPDVPFAAVYSAAGAGTLRIDRQPSWDQPGPSTTNAVAGYAGPSTISTDPGGVVSPSTPPPSRIPYTPPAASTAPITAAFMLPPSSTSQGLRAVSPYPSMDGLRSTAIDTLGHAATTPTVATQTPVTTIPSPMPLMMPASRPASPSRCASSPSPDRSDQDIVRASSPRVGASGHNIITMAQLPASHLNVAITDTGTEGPSAGSLRGHEEGRLAMLGGILEFDGKESRLISDRGVSRMNSDGAGTAPAGSEAEEASPPAYVP